MKFIKWLATQPERRGPIGDFARDAITDTEFPKGDVSRRAILLYLESLRVYEDCPAGRAFLSAWAEYRLLYPEKEGRRAISLKSRYAIFCKDGFRCQLCGASAKTGATLEVDHKLPFSKGGTNDEDNLWTLCFDCNRGKSASVSALLP